MQPFLILFDVAADTMTNNNTTKFGTDSDGNVVEVGPSLFGMDLALGILSFVGIAFVVGFIIWAAKGGKNEIEELMDQQRRGY